MIIEVVGKGFDASDLRHGRSIPHESFTYNVSRGRLVEHGVIDADSYKRGRSTRLAYLDSLRHYFDLINENGMVLTKTDIESLGPGPMRADRSDIPAAYEPLTPDERAGLFSRIRIACDAVLPLLPLSNNYTLSFSLIEDLGWIFWDIYGAWYDR